MPSSFYRLYIQFGQSNCLRFFAPGDGIITEDGLQLFEWIQDPSNIARLRYGLQHVYEIGSSELRHFLEFKLREDREYRQVQMKKYPGGGDMLAAFKQEHVRFDRLETGVEKLEVISNATEITVIPRVYPRKTSDQLGWLYLLNLDQETLEVYEFRDHKRDESSPYQRRTVKSLYRESPDAAPGYYIKLKLSGLQAMGRNEWVTLHEAHGKALDRLWKRNASVFNTVPHADSIPFAVLYGSVSHGRGGDGTGRCRSRRLTQSRLTQILAAMNRRRPSKISIFGRRRSQPRNQRSDLNDRRSQEYQRQLLRLRGRMTPERQQKRVRKG